MNRKHFDIQITGSVSNLAFPFQIMKKADELKICGYAGCVGLDRISIEAEGTKQNLDNFLTWCRKGVPGAIISDIKVEEKHCRNYREFVIKEKIK